jgi:uncharacterized protein (DUF983 family)
MTQGVLASALTCTCPSCGKGPLFSGPIRLRDACPACGQNFTDMDVGDGFVVPTLMVLGFGVVGAAIWVDFTYTPPLWLHALIWPPITIGLALVMTRYLKSFLAVQHFHTRRFGRGP